MMPGKNSPRNGDCPQLAKMFRLLKIAPLISHSPRSAAETFGRSRSRSYLRMFFYSPHHPKKSWTLFFPKTLFFTTKNFWS